MPTIDNWRALRDALATVKTGDLPWLLPTDTIRSLLDERDRLAAEVEALRASLALAANRMDVLALDHEYSTTRRNIADQWAEETRAAIDAAMKGKP